MDAYDRKLPILMHDCKIMTMNLVQSFDTEWYLGTDHGRSGFV